MVPNMPELNGKITFVANAKGKMEVHTKFGDGSISKEPLRERPGGIYEIVSSHTGDKFRIVPNTGELQILDNDGLIRIAKRLENTPKSGECR